MARNKNLSEEEKKLFAHISDEVKEKFNLKIALESVYDLGTVTEVKVMNRETKKKRNTVKIKFQRPRGARKSGYYDLHLDNVLIVDDLYLGEIIAHKTVYLFHIESKDILDRLKRCMDGSLQREAIERQKQKLEAKKNKYENQKRETSNNKKFIKKDNNGKRRFSKKEVNNKNDK